MTKPFKEVIKDAEQALLNLRVDSVNIGKQIEKERIIKLLEENHLTAASELIEQDALIKGEK